MVPQLIMFLIVLGTVDSVSAYTAVPSYGNIKAGGYNIPVELIPYKSSAQSSIILSGDRSWEIDFNELILEEEIGSG